MVDVIINPPLGIYKHLAAFSFMLAGVFADLLVVRLCLSSAYIFLIVNGLVGSPLWPHWRRPEHLTVDMLVWGVVCLYVHLSSVVRLLRDEQHVKLEPLYQEALWRMFYRVGGLSRKLFAYQIAPHMRVVHCNPGDVLPVKEYFYITYQGTVELQVHHKDNGKLLTKAVDGSGSMFDLKSLGLMQAHTPMAKHVLTVTCLTDCTFFRFSNRDIREIANAKNTKSVWQTLFIGLLARIAVQRIPQQNKTHDWEPNSYHKDSESYVDPLFRELSVSEMPNPLVAGSGMALERPLQHVWYCMQRFFTPPWPFSKHLVGVRHGMLSAPVPTEGSTSSLESGILINNNNNSGSTNNEENAPLLNKNDNNHDGGNKSNYTVV